MDNLTGSFGQQKMFMKGYFDLYDLREHGMHNLVYCFLVLSSVECIYLPYFPLKSFKAFVEMVGNTLWSIADACLFNAYGRKTDSAILIFSLAYIQKIRQ